MVWWGGALGDHYSSYVYPTRTVSVERAEGSLGWVGGLGCGAGVLGGGSLGDHYSLYSSHRLSREGGGLVARVHVAEGEGGSARSPRVACVGDLVMVVVVVVVVVRVRVRVRIRVRVRVSSIPMGCERRGDLVRVRVTGLGL